MDTIRNDRDKLGGFFRTFEVSVVPTKASLTGSFHLRSTVEHIRPASGRPVPSAAHRAGVAVNPPGTLCEGKGHMRGRQAWPQASHRQSFRYRAMAFTFLL